MPYPTQRNVEIPLLEVLVSLGGEARPRQVYPLVAKYFPNLTEEELSRRMTSAPSSKKWWNLVQWARQRLVDVNEIDGSTPGVWKITEEGRRRVRDPSAYTVPVETPSSGIAGKEMQASPKLNRPELEVTLRDLVNENQEQIRKRLITRLNELSPFGFEKFSATLLAQIGYEDLTVTKRSGDGGIDGFGDFRQGVVRLKSAFQAKRWKDAPVGRPEIDKFRGAIQGEYDHGVFLTTSRFTQEAQEASLKRGAISLLLLDGNAIAELMIEKGVGVIKQPVYLAEIDEDFFELEG